ncbi:YkvA family protein [Thalassobacillus hwangdonensis]|uniref:YkvA family protein n=1 Tax=Thalassobacillus hwangdonensis TaxID=546108 RepID=A0ABW3KZH3_9BACI
MWRFWRRLKFIFNIRKSIPFLKDFFLSREVKNRKKIISVLFIVGYFLLPLDLIPDFLAFFGILDDLTVFTLVLQQIVKMAPEHLKEKHGFLNV